MAGRKIWYDYDFSIIKNISQAIYYVYKKGNKEGELAKIDLGKRIYM